MKVCGFTFIRNALKFDYPVVESIQSVLPLCDAFVVSVGNSEDDTLSLIQSIQDPKIIITKSVWDDSLREGGRVLAEETNKAFDHIPEEFDWAIYIQADEVMHEKYHDQIRASMLKHLHDRKVEGLLFKYVHFYGTYDYIADSRKWYSHEVRIIRNDKSIRSYRDAQGFRKSGNKLQVKDAGGYIYHYGWVKDPRFQKEKEKHFHKLWHDDAWMQQHVAEEELFDYSRIDSISKFTGSHPAVMQERIRQRKWELGFDPSVKKLALKDRILHQVEKITGKRLFVYRNYRRI